MTREYLRYALMAAALGFCVLIMSAGGMVILPILFISPFTFLPDDFFFVLLALCCGYIGGPCCLLLAVSKLGSWLAAKAPLSCSASAGLLPLLPAIAILAFLPAGLGMYPAPYMLLFNELDMLQYLRITAGLLYALFLLAFCLSHRARKRTEKHGEEERPTAASGTGTMAQAYRRYLVAAAAVSVIFLPICALLSAFFMKGDLDNLDTLLWSSFLGAVISFCSGIPAVCGYWLAARAQAVSAFSPGFMPLLLPSLLFFCLSLPGALFFSSILMSYPEGVILAFLLTYGMFLLVFRANSRAGKRKKDIRAFCL
ncbi:hypothetical protein [uncultured Desulfovibrio sp.]|uniref:hypothetical protein n=1 Tax=uncultured Desulfovibrio sp. TaxID=167968 RepID=UPI002602137B|nr:hypothetical protein [uncultured Desulfovibrio sp.]